MFDEGQDIYSRLGNSHWWLVGRYRILEKYIEQFAPDEDIRFLDAGCGPAVFLKRLSRFLSGELHGVDTSSYGLALARKRMPQAHFVEGDIRSLSFVSNCFHLTVADDVIEHITEDEKAIREIYRTLKKGGYAFFCIPAFMSLWGYHDEKYGHKRRYTIEEFRTKLTNAGFVIEAIVYGQALFFVPLFIYRRLKNIIKSKREDFAPLGKRLNYLLYWLVQIDFFLCQLLRVPFGCNIFCVASKKDLI
jgi:ubiquinone/menaquinone biosynthesis C-methylase UbiE